MHDPRRGAQTEEDCAAPPPVESAISGGYVYEARRDVLEIGAHKLALFGEQGVLWTTGGAGTMS